MSQAPPQATSSLVQSTGTLGSFFRHQLFSWNHLGIVSIPLSRVGMGGLQDRTKSLSVPNLLVWMAAASSAMHLLRQTRCLYNQFMVWVKSFFNAQKYLDPSADKI